MRAPHLAFVASIGLGLALLPASPGQVRAQLISPGKLSAPHADLEGIRKCTACHELRKQGISEGLCLECHQPLARRLAQGKGFHASVDAQGCATCHKEHFGAGFALVRLDTLAFDHDRTGYALEGAHVEASCRGCHRPEHVSDRQVLSFKGEHGALGRTFLGLPDACAGCHEADQPHGSQFGARSCSECHDPREWEGASSFEHGGTEFPLRGKHADVACADCHVTEPAPGADDGRIRYVGVPHGLCTDCHADEHRGAMPGRCEGCHAPTGWKDLDRRRLEATFDHRATGFPLAGRHASASCADCHDPGVKAPGIHLAFAGETVGRAFPRPEAEGCASCHEDAHRGVMSSECASCHSERGWDRVDGARLSASFDHASTGFTLEGRHAAAECAACHDVERAAPSEGISIRVQAGTEGLAFPVPEGEGASCRGCHLDRHGDLSAGDGGECAGCHGQDVWAPAGFDASRHDRETSFALDGGHAVVACLDCHVSREGVSLFRVEDPGCVACHAGRDPHGGQFDGRACDACHGTGSFRIPDFDHDTTRFPLDGAHQATSCEACHMAEADAQGSLRIRYRPLGILCRDCHGGGS